MLHEMVFRKWSFRKKDRYFGFREIVFRKKGRRGIRIWEKVQVHHIL